MTPTDLTFISDQLSYFDVMALTMYGEARGEPVEGQIAVGWVIKNRAIAWNKGIIEVCIQPEQFSCWNENDPNYLQLVALGRQVESFYTGTGYHSNEAYNQCRYLAIGISDSTIQDNTKGALNYLTLELASGPNCPAWAKTMKFASHIGNQVFGRA